MSASAGNAPERATGQPGEMGAGGACCAVESTGATAPATSPCSTQPLASSFVRGARMVRLERFEEPYRMGDPEREAYRRRFSILFVDDSSARRGGLGTVMRATNALGETCALKTMNMPRRAEHEDDATFAARIELAHAAFRSEYESHRSLSGFKGFPRLFGFAWIGETPAIAMEWVEGVTLNVAARMLSVDESGRVAPLVAARIGRDLVDLLTRLALVGDGFVHRDISPSNILVRTAHLSVTEQAAEGAFDLCLIDFGSSVHLDPMAAPGYTMRHAMLRRATPDYAPPEMLTGDLPDLVELRKSEKIDVYAAASVIFELACGAPPFELAGRAGESLYRIKMDEAPRAFIAAHRAAFHVGDVLMFEPEAAAVAAGASLDAGDPHDEMELRRALDRVDGQLGQMLASALAPSQDARPDAEALRDGLSAFCARYAQNAGRALRGERLIPCRGDAHRREGLSPHAVNRLLVAVGTALSGAALITVVCVTALLLDGVTATVRLGALSVRGEVPAAFVGLTLALPAACAFLARGGAAGTKAAFARGSTALALVAAALLAFVSHVSFSGAMGKSPLLAALFLAVAAAWCPLVLEFVTAAGPTATGPVERATPQAGFGKSISGQAPRAGRALPDDVEVRDAAETNE